MKKSFNIREPYENLAASIHPHSDYYSGVIFSTQGMYIKGEGYGQARFFPYDQDPYSIPSWVFNDYVGLEKLFTEIHQFVSSNQPNLNIKASDKNFSGADIAGTVYGDVSAASTAYSYNKFATPQGHGFAAERANHMYDKLRGHDVQILGDNNELNGADRMVDGVAIQSKYCKTGARCIKECFNKNGEFRYWNKNGSPMQIEVPSDKYDEAVNALKDRIKNGQVSGVTDPEKAKEIVRKGHYTYEQAKNIAKAGTIDSIKFDATAGMITGAYAGGISAGITFAVSIWNGEDFEIALENAGISFLKVGGTAALTSLCVSQMARTSLNSALVGTSDAIVSALGPKAAAHIVKALGSGTNIYGAAAMKSASKLLRGNIITGIAVTGILSIVDVGNIFMGRISFGQLFKNVTTTASSVAGGTGGWMGGAALGTAIAGPVGGIIGGLIGAFAGGSVAGEVTNAVLDEFIEDDAKEMLRIVEYEFKELAGDYLVNQEEAEKVADILKDKLDASVLKDMYASSSRYSYADDILKPIFDSVTSRRQKIHLPDDFMLLSGIKSVLEDVSIQVA